MIEEMIEKLIKADAEVGTAIKDELKRQRRNIELIASENIVSEAVLLAGGSILTNKYAEGYPSKRYYGGCVNVDVIEQLAIDRAKELFGCNYANVQPHSGAQANYAAYQALTNLGDTIMGMALDQGGHLTHGSKVNFSGKYYNIVPYGVNKDTLMLDYDEINEIAKSCKPKMIIAGASAYPRIIDFEKMAEIAHSNGAYLMVDMAHIAGLVAAGLHPSPIPYADIVTTTTHKTLRGPRGGMILCNDELISKKVNSAIFPFSQGGPLEHIIAAKAVAFKEALSEEFVEYEKQILSNAQALANGLMNRGMHLVTNGTDNHLMLVDLQTNNITGKEMEERLDDIYITANKNAIPFDSQKPSITSGLRLGTPAITSRGFDASDCDKIAEIVYLCTTSYYLEHKEELQDRVLALTNSHPIYNS